jgi:undecaprenyl-phosphate galactose phosphotransferase
MSSIKQLEAPASAALRVGTIARAFTERIALVCGDLAALGAALYFAIDSSPLPKMVSGSPALSVWMQEAVPAHVIAYCSTVCLLFYWFWDRGHYNRRIPYWDELGQVLRILVTGMVTEAALLVLLSQASIDRVAFVSTWSLSFVLVPIVRVFTKRVLLSLGLWQRAVIVVGTGENAEFAVAALQDEPLLGYQIRWIGDPSGSMNANSVRIGQQTFPLVDLSKDPHATLVRLGRPRMIIAVDNVAEQEQLVREVGVKLQEVNVIPSLRGLPLHGMQIMHFFRHEAFMLHSQNNLAKAGPQLIKRVVDVVGASVLIAVLAPVWAWIAWKIWREDRGTVLFTQPRVGRNGKRFDFYKFRSMVQDADTVVENWKADDSRTWHEYESGNFKLRDDPRITTFGRFLRATSLDELPQLLNVLKGDMSLVGPRPFLEREEAYYGDAKRLYYEVRPGITGLWQISGRSNTRFQDRVALDSWYIRNWSLWTDIVILLRTPKTVLRRSGAY